MRRKKIDSLDLKKEIVIFYHANCLDGLTSAYFARKKFKNDANYIPLFYTIRSEKILKGNNININDLKDKKIYFLDFCLRKEELKRVLKIAKSVVILDHHIGVKDVILSVSGSVFGYSEKGESGAVITHRYFFPKQKLPPLAKYVGISDTLLFSKNKKAAEIERNILSYIHSLEYNFQTLALLEKELEDKKKFKEILRIGSILKADYKKRVATHFQHAKLIDFLGHRVYAVNSSMVFRSELGHYFSADRDFAVIYSFLKNISGDIVLKLSFRGDGRVDLSKIANRLGGGGHLCVSGVFIKDQKFILDFIKKIISS